MQWRPDLEEFVLGAQRRCVGHEQPRQPIATRNRPDRRAGTCRQSLLFRRVAVMLAQPVTYGGGSPTEAELDEFTPQLGGVAASLVPPACQEFDERIENAVARGLLPQGSVPQPEPTSDGLALRPEFVGDAFDRRSGGTQSSGLLVSRLSACPGGRAGRFHAGCLWRNRRWPG